MHGGVRIRPDRAAIVRQHAAGLDRRIRTRQQLALGIVQRLAERCVQARLPDDRARRVVQRARLRDNAPIARDLAADVRNEARPAPWGIAERQRAVPGVGNFSGIVDQRRGRERQVRAVGLQRAAVRIIQRVRNRDSHRAGSGLRDRAAAVHQIGRVERHLIRLDRARTVVERRGIHARRLARDLPGRVRQVRARVDRRLLTGGHRPAAVVDRLRVDLQNRLRRQRAVIDDVPGLHRHPAVAADHPALRTRRGGASGIGQLPGRHERQAVTVQRRDPPRRIVQRRSGKGHPRCALDRALTIRQRAAAHFHRISRHELPRLIRDLPGRLHLQRTLRGDLAALVRHAAGGERGAAAARQAAVIVDQRTRRIRLDGALRARRRTRQIQIARVRVQRQIAVRRRLAAGQIHATAGQRCIAARQVLAGRDQLPGRHAQIAAAPDRAVMVHARAERAGRIHAARAHRQILLRRERAAVRQHVTRRHRRALLTVDHPTVDDAALRRHVQIARRVRLAGQHQQPVRLQGQVARLRGEHAGIVDAHAVLGADQANPVRIHPAQLGHVDRHARRGAVARDRRRGQRIRIDAVGARHDIQILGVDRGVDLHGTSQQIHLVDVRRIQARAGHRHEPLGNAIAGE
ncbi:LigA [Burkholderia singularis]|uniref:LigA n=1 Tax=Burkholderia singularis TaxID=1503053 RepID=A0A238H6F0_9BURK|nr:LigA [Burkholderia singularis]